MLPISYVCFKMNKAKSTSQRWNLPQDMHARRAIAYSKMLMPDQAQDK